MAKIWINTRQGLKEITIRKVRGKDEYNIVEAKKKAVKKIIRRKIKKKVKRDIGRRIIKSRLKSKAIKPKRSLKVIGKRKSVKIEKVFEKKVTKKVIKNFLDIPTNELNLQYKSIIKEAMGRKGLSDMFGDDVLNAMIKQENINKIKWRFELRANVFDMDGTKVMQMIKGSGGDLMTLREKMRKGIWRGASVDYDVDVGDGYIFKLVNKGNVDRVEVTLVFRS